MHSGSMRQSSILLLYIQPLPKQAGRIRLSSLKTLIFCMFQNKMSIQQIHHQYLPTYLGFSKWYVLNETTENLQQHLLKNFIEYVTYLLKYEWKCEIFSLLLCCKNMMYFSVILFFLLRKEIQIPVLKQHLFRDKALYTSQTVNCHFRLALQIQAPSWDRVLEFVSDSYQVYYSHVLGGNLQFVKHAVYVFC